MPNIFCIEEIPRSIVTDEQWLAFGERCSEGLKFTDSINAGDKYTIVFTQSTDYVSPLFFVGFLKQAYLQDKTDKFNDMTITKVGGLDKPHRLLGISLEQLFCRLVYELLKLNDESENT